MDTDFAHAGRLSVNFADKAKSGNLYRTIIITLIYIHREDCLQIYYHHRSICIPVVGSTCRWIS